MNEPLWKGSATPAELRALADQCDATGARGQASLHLGMAAEALRLAADALDTTERQRDEWKLRVGWLIALGKDYENGGAVIDDLLVRFYRAGLDLDMTWPYDGTPDTNWAKEAAAARVGVDTEEKPQ